MKKRLVVLSDLWGQSKSNWENWYFEKFTLNYDIQYYDCCKLGSIDTNPYNQNFLHQQFINGGIETAVRKILKLETKEINILAFSIGGTIAWKAALKGLQINKLTTLSATRLRYEKEQPNCTKQLIYGEADSFKPSEEWFQKMNIYPLIIPNQTHDFYQNPLDFELNL